MTSSKFMTIRQEDLLAGVKRATAKYYSRVSIAEDRLGAAAAKEVAAAFRKALKGFNLSRHQVLVWAGMGSAGIEISTLEPGAIWGEAIPWYKLRENTFWRRDTELTCVLNDIEQALHEVEDRITCSMDGMQIGGPR